MKTLRTYFSELVYGELQSPIGSRLCIVAPVFLAKDQAIDYPQTRACFRAGEIRVLDSSSSVERIITFNESDRKL
jgi:hypothetical protein